MLSIIIIYIVILLLSWFIAKSNKIKEVDANDSIECLLFSIFFTFFVGSFIAWSSIFTLSSALNSIITEKKIVGKEYIVSLSNHNTTSGSFILGTGSINQIEMYYYFKKHKGGIIRDNVPTKNSVIIEQDSEPRLEIERNVIKDKWKYWLFVTNKDEMYNIYIPKNSIIKQFSVR